MAAKQNYLFNPFTSSELSFFTSSTTTKTNKTQMFLSDIDLYHQPVENPIFGIIFLVFSLITLFIGEFAHYNLYKLVSKENGLVKQTTKAYVLVQMIGYPILIAFISATDFIHPLSHLLGDWSCMFAIGFGYMYLFHILQHSFVTAMMRYLFIVHLEWVQRHGKDRIKRIFLIITLCMPIIITAWDTCDDFAPFPFISRCRGIDHRNFLSKLPDLNDAKIPCEDIDAIESFTVLSVIRKTSCIIKVILFAMLGLNIPEGFIYYAIFSHMKR